MRGIWEVPSGGQTPRSHKDPQRQRMSRDFNGEATTLSSATPGRLQSASRVTSTNVAFCSLKMHDGCEPPPPTA